MKLTGAQLVRHALEQLGIRHTFGIPGVHTTEIYDELASSDKVRPIRVGQEGNGAFMADAVSRTNDYLGTLLIVPAAGTALAYAGIGEAFLDGIPMLVITGGIPNDKQYGYRLHEIDQLEMVRAVTKGRWRVDTHADVVPTIYEAWRVAVSGEPGPVFVEVPMNVQMFPGEVPDLPPRPQPVAAPAPDAAAIGAAARLLAGARRPGLFLGWGARDATARAIALAERLNAPVGTTLQGLSVFPGAHPLHTGMGIGIAAVPAAANAFAQCDVLLAVGTRFGEIATGSFGLKADWRLIHADINPQVFNVNYQAEVAIAGDAALTLEALLQALPAAGNTAGSTDAATNTALCTQIAADKKAYLDEWLRHDSRGRVNPARFFQALRRRLADDAYLVADDGNHTFLVAELFAATRSKHVMSPTDFNCMGYCVPATIGIKLTHPDTQVVGIAGDGAFLMTGVELLTATELGLGVVIYVFNDGELSQISQAQQIPYNRKACTVLPELRTRGIAEATGAAFLEMKGDGDIARVIDEADVLARDGRPVVVDVRIDYSKSTRFTQGIVKTNLGRMEFANKLRMVGRGLWRRVRVPK